MQQRKLGRRGLIVSALGLGCMGMSFAYGVGDENESIATIHEALELGVNFFDTAEIYGPFENEKLVGRALKGRRGHAVIATKFGFNITPDGKIAGANSQPDHVKKVCDESLRRLGIDCIDLYYQHRVDPNVPIEETVGAVADLARAGKVRHLGLSEAGVDTICRAHGVYPVTALQSEYSIWERGAEDEILPVCRALGIGFVAYSPLGRGFLTGRAKRAEEYDASDWRSQNYPRLQGENYDRNLAILDAVKEMAARKNAAPGQIALAWVLRQGDDIAPIPGTKRRTYLRENVAATKVDLSVEDIAWLNEKIPAGAASGERYAEGAMRMLDR